MKVREFKKTEAVATFWSSVREVPVRTLRKGPRLEERYCLGLYLLALAGNREIQYPFLVEEGESPDFMITSASGSTRGLEVTQATTELMQEAMTWADRVYSQTSRGEEQGVAFGLSEQELRSFIDLAKKTLQPGSNHRLVSEASETTLAGAGWMNDQPEKEWAGYVQAAVMRKVAMLSEFRAAEKHDLLIYDNTPLPAVDRRKVVAALSPWVQKLQRSNSKLGNVSVITSMDVLFDIGGLSRIFPYIQWSSSDFDSDRVEHAGRVAVGEAIRRHEQKGIPVYSADSEGRLVKKLSDGRRFEVRVLPDGQEVSERELPRNE